MGSVEPRSAKLSCCKPQTRQGATRARRCKDCHELALPVDLKVLTDLDLQGEVLASPTEKVCIRAMRLLNHMSKHGEVRSCSNEANEQHLEITVS